VPGEDLPKVMYRLIDAESYQKKRILVVGGGDSAIEAAVGLARQEGNVVTLSYRKERLFRIKKKNEDKIAALFDSGAVRPLFSSNVIEIGEESVLLEVEDSDPVRLENDYVFVFAGGVPPFKFLQGMGVRFGGESLCPTGGDSPAAAGATG
jgi:thioredoxin reductase